MLAYAAGNATARSAPRPFGSAEPTVTLRNMRYIHNYNFERCHSAIGDITPDSVYYPSMLYEAAKGAA